jgi:hypothetical protein
MVTFIGCWTQKIINFIMNGVLCYFQQCAALQGNVRMFGINIDSMKVEVRARMEHFLSMAFENSYIRIWSCMNLEDVLKVLPMVMPKNIFGLVFV